MYIPLHPRFHWRESAHLGDVFHINPNRKVYTCYYDAYPLARIEPRGRGLVAHFTEHVLDSPGRPVAVPTVARGKAFVQNWIRTRQHAVISTCQSGKAAHRDGVAVSAALSAGYAALR